VAEQPKAEKGLVTASLKKLRRERVYRWRNKSDSKEPEDKCLERLGVHFACIEDRRLDFDIPPRYRPWRLWDFSVEIVNEALIFLSGDATTLYLHGDIGTGKTSLAAAILFAWRWSGGACNLECPRDCGAGRPEYSHFLPAYQAAAMLRDLDRCQDAMIRWADCLMLVLDDIGANRATPHVQEQLLFLLQERYDRCQKTIVTSNLDLNSLAVALGERAASRLQEGILVELTGGDRRGMAATFQRPTGLQA